MRRGKSTVHIRLTKHHIVSTKQGNSGTRVGLQIIEEAKKDIREENLILYNQIPCICSDVDCFFV